MTPTKEQDSIIKITNLSKYYGDVKAVDHLDLEIHRVWIRKN